MMTVNSTGVVRRTNAPAYINVMDLTGTAAIAAGSIATTASASTSGSTTTKIYTITFTLARASLLLVDAVVAVKNITTTAGAAITDGSPRMVKSYWQFSTGTNRYGASSTVYTNAVSDTQNLSGIFDNNNGFNTILAAGTYTLDLYILTGCSSNRNFTVTYGSDISDRISVKAVQLQ